MNRMPKKSEPHSLVGIQHIRLLVENAPEGMVICDLSNRITYANRVFCEMFGYALEETMGKDINSIVSRSAPVRKEAGKIASHILETPYVIENTIRENRMGEPVHVSLLAGPIRDNGRLVGAYGVYRDISESKRMEADIQRERVFFEKLFSDTPIAILICDCGENVVRANRAFLDMFGYTVDEITGGNADTLVTTGDEMLREARNANSAVWNRREMLTLNTVRTKKDGTPIPVKIYQFPFQVDENTHLDYNVFIDMSDQARLENSIRKEKIFFETLFESSPYSVTLEDTDGTILKANKAFYDMFGYSVSDNIIGSDVNEIVALDPEIQKEARGMDNRFWTGENINQDVVRQRKDGSLIHLSLVQTLLELPDGARLVYVIYGDITSRVRASETLKRRLRFQKLTASLSSLFLEKGELASKLARGLTEINAFLETDAAWVVSFDENDPRDQRLTAKSPADAPDPPRLSWLGKEIRKRRSLDLETLRDIPADTDERRFFGEAGFNGLLATAIGLEQTRGFVVFGRRLEHVTPNEEDLGILSIFANILDQAFGRAEAEEELFRHRQMLEGIVETQNDFIVRWKPDFTITFANAPYCRFRNVDPETICGTSLLDLIPKEDVPAEHAFLERILSGETLIATEEKETNIEGETRWMHWYDKAIYDGRGRLVEIQSEGRDITQLKEIQQELERSEKRYQSIVQDQDDMVIRITPDDGSLTFVNDAYCRRFGKSREELLGSSIFAHVDCGEAGRLCREHFEKLTPENPTNIDNSYSVFPGGKISYEQWSNRGIFDAAGNLVEIQCVGRDVTESKIAEKRLKESEQRYLTIVNDQMDFVVRFSPEGQISFANRAYEKRMGLGVGEAMLRNFLNSLETGPAAYLEETLFPSLTPEHPVAEYETVSTSPDCKKCREHWIFRGIFDTRGFLREIQAVGRDFTKIKETEEALRETTQLYLGMVENQVELVCRFNMQGDLLFANDAYCNYFDVDRATVPDQKISLILPPREWEQLEADLMSLSPDNPYIFREHPVYGPGGDRRWTRWSNRGVFSAEGDLLEILAVGRDTTDIKKASDELEHLNDVLRAVRGVNRLINRERNPDRLIPGICGHLLDTRGYANVWIALMDGTGKLFSITETGRDSGGNPLSEKLCNLELNDWGWKVLLTPGVTLNSNLVPFSDFPLMDSYKDKGVMTTRLEHEGVILGLICVSLPDGFVADSEEQDLFFETAQDIAAAIHVLDEEKKRESQKRETDLRATHMEKLLHDYRDGLWEWDITSGRTFFSSGYTAMLGYEADDVAPSYDGWKDLIHPEDRDRATENVQRCLAAGGSDTLHQVYRMRTAQGGWKKILDRANVVKRNAAGEGVRMVGIHIDIGDQLTEKACHFEKSRSDDEKSRAQAQ